MLEVAHLPFETVMFPLLNHNRKFFSRSRFHYLLLRVRRLPAVFNRQQNKEWKRGLCQGQQNMQRDKHYPIQPKCLQSTTTPSQAGSGCRLSRYNTV